MLTHLSIRDIVLIERLDIDFANGLSVLTGETGAGKSILLDALSLALGARGDVTLVRSGAQFGTVAATFDIPINHPVRDKLRENGLDDEGDIILRRQQNADGRSRVFINDQPASVGLLRQLGAKLVEIHGQHDDRALVDAQIHRDLLDAFGGLIGEAAAVSTAWRLWRERETMLVKHRAKVEAAAREADFLRSSLEELVKIDPQSGEETGLADRRAAMMRAEKIASEIHDAQNVLSGPDAVIAQLSGLLRRLQRKADEAPDVLNELIRTVDEALVCLDQSQSAVDEALRAIEFDPAELDRAEERLFALRAIARKHNVTVDQLAELRDRMAADLADLDAGEERLASLEKEARAAGEAYDNVAERLSQMRHGAAGKLAEAVDKELPALKLEQAEFLVDVVCDAELRGEAGIDHVEFQVRTNPGTRAGPIMKVASGGELSRFLLALKVVLADRGSAPTLVFDEIDTGVGGAVADAIGQRLARLAERIQVLSVTHAPQVAARARSHYLITKNHRAGSVITGIAIMDTTERQEEIARMLAGATITSEARAAAERLLRENASAV